MNTQLSSLKRKLTYIAVASCFTITPAFGNPAGGVVTSGSATISTQGNTLTVTNMPNSIINWQQFSIGAGEITRFVQQNAQSAVLNRVVGQDPSAILGQLLSNGRVFLINPNGILFGVGSRVDVAGLVVSTLNMTDQDFLNGKFKFAGGDNAGNIVNQGELTSTTGGQIYLVAPKIENSGIITSPQGEIILAAGHTVNLVDAANPEIQVSLTAPDTEVVNIGQIVAQSGKVGLYASLISQQGVINADRAVQDVNGDIILKASKTVDLEVGSVTSAQGGGQIKAFADMQHGQVNVAGTLDASAPVNGDGGFIETSAAHVKVADTARVTTLAANGKTGTWLIDPVDFTIALGGAPQTISGIGADTLSSNLDTTDVSIATSATTSGNGDIFVNGDLSWANHVLTLTAHRNIDINADIRATGATSGLNLYATNGMVNVNNATNSNDVTVDIVGNINVNAKGMLVQGGSASSSNASTLFEASGNITLTLGSIGLAVRGGNALGSSDGGAAFAEAKIHANNITINGSVVVAGGIAESNASANASIEADNNININGSVSVIGGSATASNSSASANAKIKADNNININGSVSVIGGSATANDSSDANANASIIAASNLSINGSVSVIGGTASGGNSGGSGNAEAKIQANNITLNGSVAVAGGVAESGASANASIEADNNININGSVSVIGGSAIASDSYDASANASIIAASNISIKGKVSVLGGTATANGSDASASASINSGNDIFITGKSVSVRGGKATASSSSANANAKIVASNEIHIMTTGMVQVAEGVAISSSDGSAHADATIEASPDTIFLTFTNLNCCGVTVNGNFIDVNSQTVYGNSGFFVGGSNAILNQNLFVTYLGLPPLDTLLFSNGPVGNNMGEPLWTFLGNSLDPQDNPEELNKLECSTHA